MTQPNHDGGRLRDRLLDQYTPERGTFDEYQKEVRAMLDRNEKNLRRERWVSAMLWLYAVALCTAFALVAGYGREQTGRVYFVLTLMLGTLFVSAAVEMLKYFINRSRVELLKEIKGVELRLAGLEERLGGHTGTGPR